MSIKLFTWSMKWYGVVGYLILLALILWGIATLITLRKGPDKLWSAGNKGATQRALIVYNPDPFYNLDEQACKSFATGLTSLPWYVTTATVRSAAHININDYDLLVFCANTYNWSPDRATKQYIRSLDLQGKTVAALTLGAGSTEWSQKKLEDIINAQGATLIGSESIWLTRPNDDTQVVANNILMANRFAEKYGEEIAQLLYDNPNKP